MKQLQIQIKDNSKVWGIFDIIQVNWNVYNHQIESIKIDWHKTGEDLLFMSTTNFDGNFTDIYGKLFGKIINEF